MVHKNSLGISFPIARTSVTQKNRFPIVCHLCNHCGTHSKIGEGGAATCVVGKGMDKVEAMSISGAAIDAAVLIQADKVSVRIWMSLLSLQMGDWLRVHDGHPHL